MSTLFPKRGEEVVVQRFDKVVMATGINDVPFVPTIKGIEKFGGTVLHSGSYKRFVFPFLARTQGRRILLSR